MVTTTGGIQGLNPETQNVMNYMSGVRTKKQIVGEFFGLREEAVYDDEGVNVVDFINDFKDVKTLEKKGVHYNTRFAEFNVSEADFNGLFYGEIPSYGRKKQSSNSGESTKTETKQGLSSDSKGIDVSEEVVKPTNNGGRNMPSKKRKVSSKK